MSGQPVRAVANPTIAVLSREIQVRVLNCSAAGCLLESTAPLEVGTIASISLLFEGRKFSDDLRVVRCQSIEGASTYRVGAEFLWTAPPGPNSLRLGIARQQELDRAFSSS